MEAVIGKLQEVIQGLEKSVLSPLSADNGQGCFLKMIEYKEIFEEYKCHTPSASVNKEKEDAKFLAYSSLNFIS